MRTSWPSRPPAPAAAHAAGSTTSNQRHNVYKDVVCYNYYITTIYVAVWQGKSVHVMLIGLLDGRLCGGWGWCGVIQWGGKTRPPELPLHDNIFRQTVVSIFRHCSYLIDNGKSQLVAANESEVHTIHKFGTSTFLSRCNFILSYDRKVMFRLSTSFKIQKAVIFNSCYRNLNFFIFFIFFCLVE